MVRDEKRESTGFEMTKLESLKTKKRETKTTRAVSSPAEARLARRASVSLLKRFNPATTKRPPRRPRMAPLVAVW